MINLAVENSFVWSNVFRDRERVRLETEVAGTHKLTVFDGECAAYTLTQTVDEDLLDEFGVFSVEIFDFERLYHAVEHVDERLEFALLVCRDGAVDAVVEHKFEDSSLRTVI